MIQQTIIIKNPNTVLTIFCQVQVGDAPPTIYAIALAVRNNEELVVDVVVKTCVYHYSYCFLCSEHLRYSSQIKTTEFIRDKQI